jgi:hypothetical protein
MSFTIPFMQLLFEGGSTTLQPGDRLVLDAAKNSVQFVRGAGILRIVSATDGASRSEFHCEFGKNAAALWVFIAQFAGALTGMDVEVERADENKAVFVFKERSVG